MRLAKIEAALERLVEGAVGRVVGGRLHPLEVYRGLWREVEGGRIISAGATYIPNRLVARLNKGDLEAVQGVQDRLEAELASGLEAEAQAEGWKYGARMQVRLEASETLRPGAVVVEGKLDRNPVPAVVAFENGARAGETVSLEDGAVLGRSAECSIYLPDPAVSRRHCRFDWLFEGYSISDFGSSNGTLVNDVQVSQYVLSHNDLITAGETRLRFRYL